MFFLYHYRTIPHEIHYLSSIRRHSLGDESTSKSLHLRREHFCLNVDIACEKVCQHITASHKGKPPRKWEQRVKEVIGCCFSTLITTTGPENWHHYGENVQSLGGLYWHLITGPEDIVMTPSIVVPATSPVELSVMVKNQKHHNKCHENAYL